MAEEKALSDRLSETTVTGGSFEKNRNRKLGFVCEREMGGMAKGTRKRMAGRKNSPRGKGSVTAMTPDR